MVNCPLPNHDDSTPSFNLWGEDEAGVPTRFGCFGCGRKGDVVDLIAALEDVPPADAGARATELYAEEQSDDTVRERAPRAIKEPARPLAEVYDQIVRDMRQPDFRTFQEFAKSKGFVGDALELYLMDDWGLAASRGRIVLPHRAPDGSLTGLKYRAGSRKWNEEGSRYPFLYGTWRDGKRKRAVIVEGETDTLWAAWSLREVDDVDVFGMPSGAEQEIQGEWVERLEGRDVVLMMDMDAAGVRATKRWREKLPGALVSRLPEGEDVVSAGIPVLELLDRASMPMRATGLVTVDRGVFAKVGQNGNAPLGDFAFEPVRELITEDGPAWEGHITGDRRLALIRSTDLHSGSTVIRWANRHGRAWTGGTGPGVQGVFNWLSARSAYMPQEQAVMKAGKIGRSFVGPGFCVGPDRVRYIPPTLGDAQLASRIHVQEGAWDPRAIVALERLNAGLVMATILGWLCATMLRGQRAPAPPLFVSGESGSGKTNMLRTALGAFGFGTETNLTTTTPFGVDCMVNSCVGFPVWFDEYRGGAREDSMSRLRQLLRDAYYGQPSMKGGMRQQATELTEVTTWSGIVVSGEMSSQETSHRDRMVMIDLDPEARNRDAYRWLQDRERTAGLGRALLEFLAAREPSLFKVAPHGDAGLPDRFRETLGFVKTGWDAWVHFRWTVAGLSDAPPGPDFDELAHGRRDVEDPWLEALKACEGVYRDNFKIVEQTDEGVRLIPNEVIVEARRVGIELPARASELVQWLRRRYTVRESRVDTRRAKLAVGMHLDS